MRIYKNLKLFFYSFLFRKIFLSKLLKIHILTVQLLHKTGTIKILGGTAGGMAGGAIKPQLSFILIPLGAIIGSAIGGLIDEQLYQINKKIKSIDKSNDEYIQNNQIIQTKLHNCIVDILQDIIYIAENYKETNTEKQVLEIINNKISNKYFDNRYKLTDNEKIKQKLIQLINNI